MSRTSLPPFFLPLLAGILMLCPSTLLAITSKDLIHAALDRTQHAVRHDPAARPVRHPGDDTSADTGVGTDVVIRSYRALGIDLQKLVHEDMRRHFSQYPSRKLWGLHHPDAGIDHRRVPNLQVFFTRKGKKLGVTNDPHGFTPGDIVTWMLPGNLPHIGIVTDRYNYTTGNPMIVHDTGRGPKLEDMLFAYPITGHYRYLPR